MKHEAYTADGIGAKKAQQIILYRQMMAPFATADDLANVKGIGKATVDKIATASPPNSDSSKHGQSSQAYSHVLYILY